MLSSHPGLKPELATYLFAVVARDPSRVVRRHVARSLTEALLMALETGAVHGGTSVQQARAEDPSGTMFENSRAVEAAVEVNIKALRNDVGKSKVMRSGIMSVLT